MGKHSSGSDSSSVSNSRRKHSKRSKSSSGSDSNHRRGSSRRDKPSSHKHQKSQRYKGRRSRSRGSSKYSRSVSRDRDRDRDRDRHRRRSRSRDGYRRRDRKEKSRRRTSSTSSSSSHNSSRKHTPISQSSAEALREKLLQAIKAAESADTQLKQQGVLPRNVKSRNNISALAPVMQPDSDAIQAIETDGFVPKAFKSSKSKISETVKSEINLDVATVPLPPPDPQSVFHASFFDDPQTKLDRWVKKLYQIREKARNGEPPL